MLSLIQDSTRYNGELAAPSAFMASIGVRKGETLNEPTVEAIPPFTDISKRKASGRSMEASITKTTDTPNEKAMAQKSNPSAMVTPNDKTITAAGHTIASLDRTSNAELMDLEIDQETTQPVLHFTAPSTKEQPSSHTDETHPSLNRQTEALEKSGLLTATHLDMLELIEAEVSARGNGNAPTKEAYRRGTYTKSELVSLRPAAVVPKVTNSIAREIAQLQDAFLIGEHVHKTRYHTAASLSEDLKSLSTSDKSSVKPASMNRPTTEKPRIEPIDHSSAKGKRPSLAPHLLNQPAVADHRSAARAQYSGGHGILAPTSNIRSQGDVSLTTRPARRNMINQTGFIALAENGFTSVAADKEREDPLLVARKRGF